MKEAQATIAVFKKADPGLSRFFNAAVGYAVFPSITKRRDRHRGSGRIRGALREGQGDRQGLGLAGDGRRPKLGGQSYSEIIFFETDQALNDFKNGTLALAAQVSAVAAKAGASDIANYQTVEAVFTAGKGGLMFEASVGGQKFSFEPYSKK